MPAERGPSVDPKANRALLPEQTDSTRISLTNNEIFNEDGPFYSSFKTLSYACDLLTGAQIGGIQKPGEASLWSGVAYNLYKKYLIPNFIKDPDLFPPDSGLPGVMQALGYGISPSLIYSEDTNDPSSTNREAAPLNTSEKLNLEDSEEDVEKPTRKRTVEYDDEEYSYKPIKKRKRYQKDMTPGQRRNADNSNRYYNGLDPEKRKLRLEQMKDYNKIYRGNNKGTET